MTLKAVGGRRPETRTNLERKKERSTNETLHFKRIDKRSFRPLVLNRCSASFLQVFREIMKAEFFLIIIIMTLEEF